ncbi:MAG: ATP-binding protein [bacterium]|nr:ATP-binding protein [bacterium]
MNQPERNQNRKRPMVVKSKLLQTTIRDSGYTTVQALLDIIDNSYEPSVQASSISVDIKNPFDVIRIADNGNGIRPEAMQEVLQLGSNEELTRDGGEYEENSMGKYGIGLVASALSIGTKITLMSWHKSSKEPFKVSLDLNNLDIETADDGTEMIMISLESLSKEETYRFYDNVNSKQGTVVEISGISRDRIDYKSASSFRDELTQDLGRVYRYFLSPTPGVGGFVRNCRLFVDGERVVPQMRDLSDTLRFSPSGKSPADLIEDRTVSLTGGDGQKSSVRVILWRIPAINRQDMLVHGLNPQTQGFSIVRNGREIMSSETLGLYNRHPQMNRFRAELHFTSEADDVLGVDWKKTKVKISESITAQLKREIGHHLPKIRQNTTRTGNPAKLIKNNKTHLIAKAFNSEKDKLNITKAKKNVPDVIELSYKEKGDKSPIFLAKVEKGTTVMEINANNEFVIQRMLQKGAATQIPLLTVMLAFTRTASKYFKKDKKGYDKMMDMFNEELAQIDSTVHSI